LGKIAKNLRVWKNFGEILEFRVGCKNFEEFENFGIFERNGNLKNLGILEV
jgi:hypothetical protein